ERFFEAVADYGVQARGNLERVAQQFQEAPRRAARLEPIRWEPDATGRWENAQQRAVTPPDGEVDPARPVVIARCLDSIAHATERLSGLAREINLRNSGR